MTRHRAPIIFFLVRSATLIGAGCFGAGNRKRKNVAEKTTGPLKSKQTSITTVRYPIQSVDRLPTPLIFRYPLPISTLVDFKVKLLYRGYPRDWNIPDGEDGCQGNEEAKEAAQLPSKVTGGQQERQGQPQAQPHSWAESQLT